MAWQSNVFAYVIYAESLNLSLTLLYFFGSDDVPSI
ncbi:hypothetical protein SAMN05428973_108231 [Duganella sp. OV510]|jgi:hypothetical protein|nr:hypothetical protein SAMN05428973_108231 [Duganella sp. OV510]